MNDDEIKLESERFLRWVRKNHPGHASFMRVGQITILLILVLSHGYFGAWFPNDWIPDPLMMVIETVVGFLGLTFVLVGVSIMPYYSRYLNRHPSGLDE